MFNLSFLSHKIHKYPAKSPDVLALHSLLKLCHKSGPRAYDERSLRLVYERTAREYGVAGDFAGFVETYASGRRYAPVLVFDGQRYQFDGPTLSLFFPYIAALNDHKGGRQRVSGRQVFCDQANRLGAAFEREVRQKFRREGWKVFPSEGRKQRLGPKKHEHDCVAIDHHSKIIVLAEAKYENVSAYAMHTNRLVGHIVLGKNGLLSHAKKHHEKSKCFRRYCYASFGMDDPWRYRIVPVIVTKHTPVIKKHLTVHLIPYRQFETLDFKTLA